MDDSFPSVDFVMISVNIEFDLCSVKRNVQINTQTYSILLNGKMNLVYKYSENSVFMIL